MRNIKLCLEYDGTNYSGWQYQSNSITIQQKVEEAIEKILKCKCNVYGCSRTDSGVHAKEYVCNFFTDSKLQVYKFANAFNAKLPLDIRIIYSEECELNFHSRYCSTGKTYSYSIFNRYVAPALNQNYVCHIKPKLDINLMKAASEALIGTHDFSSFRSNGSDTKTSVRTIKEINIVKEQDTIKIFITADGFLYNMMRIICGTLINVGRGKTAVEEMVEILEACDRNRAGKTAIAKGLCLEKVLY